MSLDPAILLAGPRGRRVCLEYARAYADEATSMALGWAAYAREDHGSAVAIAMSSFGDVDPGPFVPPVVSAKEAASALDASVLSTPTAASLRAALRASVDAARYWQAPDGADQLADEPVMLPALARMAEVIAASPHAAWWTTGVALSEQWALPWDGGGATQDDQGLKRWSADIAEGEARCDAQQARDPDTRFSGTWWSKPPTALVHTTRALADHGPAGLWFVEDSMGEETAVATPVHPASARVIEIDGPDAWIDLCRRHPLVVTASRRWDWFRVTGRDGGWVQPDWASVASEADGVHLTVAGYLAAATRLLDVGEGWGSVLAGWNPDETYWFGRTSPVGPGVQWQYVDDAWESAE